MNIQSENEDGVNAPEGMPKATMMSWLKLMRLPTVFTALSNILCGFFVSQNERDLALLFTRAELWLLLLASAGLYLGGMVLNDVFDAALDARERPERPIPAGLISKRAAAVFGTSLMVIGVATATTAGFVSKTGMLSTQIACVLAACIVLYDAVLKSTIASPLGMATCRFLNVMLGASCAGTWQVVWSGPQLAIATALFIYILGVTWFARNEAGHSKIWALIAALAVVMCGIGTNLWSAAQVFEAGTPAVGAMIALSLIAANVGIRGAAAIRANQPRILQKTVGFMLLNVIFIDAAMTFCVTGSGRIAAAVVILVIPATLLKRVVPMS